MNRLILIACVPVFACVIVRADETPGTTCLGDAQRQRIDAEVAANRHALGLYQYRFGATSVAPVAFPFVPIAGTVYKTGDTGAGNFVDLDPTSPGFKDFMCSSYTYDQHRGTDLGVRWFADMDLGVPVFAALGGTVVGVHDGEFDRWASFQYPEPPVNYVTIDHGSSTRTTYLHFKKNSIQVALGQVVQSGQQLGLAGSSGFSAGPHLHFETTVNGQTYEPWAGACRSGPSGWVNQPVFPVNKPQFWNAGFVASPTPIDAYPEGFPSLARFSPDGSTSGVLWYGASYIPPSSKFRAILTPPPGPGRAPITYGPFDIASYILPQSSRPTYWFLFYYEHFSYGDLWTGVWTIQMQILDSAQSVLSSTSIPLTLVGTPAELIAPAYAPFPVSAAFDPPAPRTSDVLFARLSLSNAQRDPQGGSPTYRYLWKRTGVTLRDVTHAGLADAIPKGSLLGGRTITCQITPTVAPGAVAHPWGAATSQTLSVIIPCTVADITDGSGAGAPDGTLTGSDVVKFFQAFFTGCAPGSLPCGPADITDGSGAGPADGTLTGADVVAFFQAFFTGCP